MTDAMSFTLPEDLLPAPRSERGAATPQTVDMLRAVIGPYVGNPLDEVGALRQRSAQQDFEIYGLETRVRDLELVCKAQQKALNHLLVSLPASHSKDLKHKIWPEMNAAEMILNGD